MIIRRVAYVLPKQDFFQRGPGGAVTHACGVASGLAANGIDVTVLSGPEASTQMRNDVNVIEVDGAAERMAWEGNIVERIEQVSREVDATIVRYSVSNAWRFARLMRRMRDEATVWCFEVNSLLYHQPRKVPYWIRKWWLPVEGMLIDSADVAYVVSDMLERDLSPYMSDKVTVVPNGGPPPWSPPIAERPGANSPIRFCYFGKLNVYYEYDVTIEAVQDVRRQVQKTVELHFYGDGPEYRRLRRRVRDMDGIYCHGRYDHGELETQVDGDTETILILPYTGTDAGAVHSPIKLYEYMAMGGAIIAAKVGEIRKELEDGRTALLYECGDVESLVHAMLLLIRDPGLRVRMGRDVQRKYIRTSTWPRRMESLLSTLEDVGT